MLRLLAILLLLHVYIGVRVAPDLPIGAAGTVLFVLALAVLYALMPLGLVTRRLERQPLADRIALASYVAMGIFSSLLVLTLLRDLSLLVPWPESYRSYSAAAVPLLAVLLTVVGFFNARQRARVRPVDVPIADLPPDLQGFTIAQISDIHVGPTIKRPYVEAIVDAVNALRPDLIAVTGDLVDGPVSQLAQHTEPFGRLSARHGVYFVTGNHEYYSGARAWIAELRRLGLHVLLNEHVVVEHGGEQIVVAGVTDYSAGHFDAAQRSDPQAAMAGAPPDAAVKLLLAHQPRSAFAAASVGYDLQLSGHTHGGQFFPWNFFVRLQQPFTAGLHRLGDLWVYISRGTGYWGPPKRLWAPSEITQLRLVGRSP
jgi:predicted MPP superfamily phosphohydrolase